MDTSFMPRSRNHPPRRPYTRKKLAKSENPVYVPLRDFISEKGTWIGTPDELRKALDKRALEVIPTAVHIFMRRVNNAMDDLKTEGVVMEGFKRGGKTMYRISGGSAATRPAGFEQPARPSLDAQKPVLVDLSDLLRNEEEKVKGLRPKVAGMQAALAKAENNVRAIKSLMSDSSPE